MTVSVFSSSSSFSLIASHVDSAQLSVPARASSDCSHLIPSPTVNGAASLPEAGAASSQLGNLTRVSAQLSERGKLAPFRRRRCRRSRVSQFLESTLLYFFIQHSAEETVGARCLPLLWRRSTVWVFQPAMYSKVFKAD